MSFVKINGGVQYICKQKDIDSGVNPDIQSMIGGNAVTDKLFKQGDRALCEDTGNEYIFDGTEFQLDMTEKSQNVNAIIREPFVNMTDINSRWDITTGTGDLVELAGNVAGAGYLKISKSAWNVDTETRLVSKFTIKPPFRAHFGVSIGQKIAGQRFSIGVAGVDENGNLETEIPVAVAIPIATIAQSATTVTVTTNTNHGLVAGDRVCISGVSDSRLNYGEMIVQFANDKKTVILTNDINIDTNIPSLTISQINNSGLIVKIDTQWNANNSFNIIFDNISTSTARLGSRCDKSPELVKNSVSVGTHTGTASQSTSASSDGADGWTPNLQFEMTFATDITVRTNNMDSSAASAFARQSNAIPMADKEYKVVITARNDIEGMSRPVAKIVSATKAGSAVATIVTEQPHGLTTGDVVLIKGLRDQANFLDTASQTAVASVVNATTFTISFGASYTGVSYGGAVYKMQGSHTPSPLAQIIQSASRVNGLLKVVGTATWTGIAAGETVELIGVRDTAGATVNIDGTYKVWSISTTTLALVDDRVDFGSINCGGNVCKRTDMRLHFLRILDYNREIVEVSNRGSVDAQDSLPVFLSGSTGSLAVAGVYAHDSASNATPVMIGMRAQTANQTAVATGDTCNGIGTLVGAQITKPYSIPEAEWCYSAPRGGLLNTVTPLTIKEMAGVGIKNYITGFSIYAEALTNATEFEIREPDVACNSQTIASNTLTTATAHGLSVGDEIVATASTVTGLTANTTYYVLTVPTSTTVTLSATRGGTVLTISGSSVTATIHKVLWSTKIPTTGKPEIQINLPSPIKSAVNTTLQIQTITASGAGAVFFNAQGYVAP